MWFYPHHPIETLNNKNKGSWITLMQLSPLTDYIDNHRPSYCKSIVTVLQLLYPVCWTSLTCCDHMLTCVGGVWCVCVPGAPRQSPCRRHRPLNPHRCRPSADPVSLTAAGPGLCVWGTKHKDRTTLEWFFFLIRWTKNAKENQPSSSGSCCVVERWWGGVVDPEFAGSWRLETTADLTPGRLRIQG